jgi:organic hydroperoxide reductase OsmC/OhrA
MRAHNGPMAPSLPPPSDRIHRYRSSVSWAGSTGVGYDAYGRDHRAATDPPTVDLALSSDPAFGGTPSRLDPEQLLVTAVASCQLLSFLAVAARARLDVVAYRDEAEAVMPEDDRPLRLTRIELRPHITVAVGGPADVAAVERRVRHLSAVAHRECYIANSIRSEIVIEPTIAVVDDTSSPLQD